MLVTRVSKTFSLVILRALGLEIQSFVADSWLAVLPRPQLIYVLVYPLSPLEVASRNLVSSAANKGSNYSSTYLYDRLRSVRESALLLGRAIESWCWHKSQQVKAQTHLNIPSRWTSERMAGSHHPERIWCPNRIPVLLAAPRSCRCTGP